MPTEEFGLGRLPAEDERDRLFPVTTLLPEEAPARTYRYWYANAYWGNQGNKPHCVEYSWHHYMADGPVTRTGPYPLWQLGSVYYAAQRVDEWPGENYDGTSVRAGAKVLQSLGRIREYRWAFNLADIVNTVLLMGPVVLGTNWYESMFYPDASGLIKVGGDIAGGHAYTLNGVNTKTKLFRIKNSWGRGWANEGHAWIRFADVERLLHEQGEAAIAIENP